MWVAITGQAPDAFNRLKTPSGDGLDSYYRETNANYLSCNSIYPLKLKVCTPLTHNNDNNWTTLTDTRKAYTKHISKTSDSS